MKTILFVCGHNAGRSQMAEAFVNALAARRGLGIRAISAGTNPGDGINPAAAAAMEEIGVPMAGQVPKVMTQAMADEADRIITMGCGVDVSACPAGFLATEDWELDDPAGQSMQAVRTIRDTIHMRVEALVHVMATVG
jgi:arsenate reductase